MSPTTKGKVFFVPCPYCGVEVEYDLIAMLKHGEIHADEAKRDYVPSEKRVKVFNKTSGICFYCGDVLSLSPNTNEPFMAIDHFFPKSKGGSNNISNLVPSCPRCNGMKGVLSIEDFRGKFFSWRRTDRRFYFEKRGLLP